MERIKVSPYIANATWLSIEKLIRIPVMLLIGVYLARYLGPEAFGTLNYAMSFVSLFAIFITLGVEATLVREIIKKPEERDEILGSAFALRVLGTLLVWCLIGLIILLSNHSETQKHIIVIFTLTLSFQSFNVIDLYFQSNSKLKYVAISQLIQLLFFSISKIILILINASITWIAFSYLIDSIILSAAYIYYYIRYTHKKVFWKYSFETMKRLFLYSWPLIISGAVITAYMKIDQVMINTLLGPKEVGIYAAAMKISQGLYFIPIIIGVSVYPKMVELFETDSSKKNLYRYMQRICDYLVLISLILALTISISSGLIINTLYGETYSKSSIILSIHTWTFIFIFSEVIIGKWAIITGNTTNITARNIVAAIINICLNYLLIPIYGALGAAIASLISIFISYYLFFIFFKETRSVFKIQTLSIISMGLYTTTKELRGFYARRSNSTAH